MKKYTFLCLFHAPHLLITVEAQTYWKALSKLSLELEHQDAIAPHSIQFIGTDDDQQIDSVILPQNLCLVRELD